MLAFLKRTPKHHLCTVKYIVHIPLETFGHDATNKRKQQSYTHCDKNVQVLLGIEAIAIIHCNYCDFTPNLCNFINLQADVVRGLVSLLLFNSHQSTMHMYSPRLGIWGVSLELMGIGVVSWTNEVSLYM